MNIYYKILKAIVIGGIIGSILVIIGIIIIKSTVKNQNPVSTTLIENGSVIHLKSREDIYIYLIDRYKTHLQKECDTTELKVVNDVLESRYDMP